MHVLVLFFLTVALHLSLPKEITLERPGLDISSVSTVVHYDVARMVDTFIHRSGRTAVRDNSWQLVCEARKRVTLQINFGNDDFSWTRVSDVHQG